MRETFKATFQEVKSNGSAKTNHKHLVKFEIDDENHKIFQKLGLSDNELVDLIIEKIDKDKRRNTLNLFGTWVSIIVALLSIVLGIFKDKIPQDELYSFLADDSFASWIVAGWVILPPVFFWWDWLWSRHIEDDQQLDKIKHNHDLARNIWLGLTALLVVLFEIKWPL